MIWIVPTELKFWNGCECETIETTSGCTNVFAENYDPEADCDDGSCIISNYYFIPNTVSISDLNPLNSQFQIQGNNIELIEWSIFDRWGNLVFQGNELYDTWDGSFNGQQVPQGVYVYIGVLFFFNGEEVEFKGSITLLD